MNTWKHFIQQAQLQFKSDFKKCKACGCLFKPKFKNTEFCTAECGNLRKKR